MTNTNTNPTLAKMDDAALLAWAKEFREMDVATTIAKERTFTATVGEFPANAVDRYFRHGFQRLHNDAVGGKDKFATTAAKMEYVEAHLADMKAGKVGRQSAGAGATPEIIRARSILRRALKAKLDPAAYKRDFTDADVTDQIKRLDELLAKNPKIVDKARKELEAEAALADDLDI